MPTFFVREYRDYDVTAKDFAIPVGLAVLLGGGMGCFLGGFISDRYIITVCVQLCVSGLHLENFPGGGRGTQQASMGKTIFRVRKHTISRH